MADQMKLLALAAIAANASGTHEAAAAVKQMFELMFPDLSDEELARSALSEEGKKE